MSELAKKYKKLVDDLYTSTMAKSLGWEEDWQGNIFVSLGGRIVQLDGSRSSDGEPLEVVEIKDGDQIIDYFNDTNLRSLTPGVEFSNYYEKMSELRKVAIRQARGADEAIDDVLNALKK